MRAILSSSLRRVGAGCGATTADFMRRRPAVARASALCLSRRFSNTASKMTSSGDSACSSGSPPAATAHLSKAAGDVTKEEEEETGEDEVTPWSVAAKGPQGVNYDRVLTKFKAQRVDQAVVDKLQRVAAKRAEQLQRSAVPPLHHFFTRGVVFSHRDFDKALDAVEASLQPGRYTAYLYTGRGPSAGCMHIGHVIPFLLSKYLQDVLGLPLVVQITDDEKYLFRDTPFAGPEADAMITENIKDILAFGFNPRNTFVFRNTQYMGEMYPTVLALQHSMTASAVKNTFGITDSDNVGKLAFPATQAAPCFSDAFKRVLQNDGMPMQCIIPCAIDQDPFFVLTRGIAPRLKTLSPALLHTKFLPALKGLTHKMSSSAAQNGLITLHDTDVQVRKKLRKAFSGGSGTLEEMQAKGSNLEVDVAYQFIRFFCPDEAEFQEITEGYAHGALNSGEVKDIAADYVIKSVLHKWRERRATVTDEEVEYICSIRNILF